MSKAHFLQNKDGEKFYPYAHADATFTSDGEKVGKKITDINERIDNLVLGEINVQSDWSETDSTSDTYIKNKPDTSAFITSTVSNLQNYYLKTETYTKEEVKNLIDAIATMSIEVVSVLPTVDISTMKIYLLQKEESEEQNIYTEYINIDGTASGWECIGDTKVGLNNYYTKDEVDALIQGENTVFLTQAEYDALDDSKYTDGKIYYITDGATTPISAGSIDYDDTNTSFGVTNVQSAIEKISGDIGNADISNISSTVTGSLQVLKYGLDNKNYNRTISGNNGVGFDWNDTDLEAYVDSTNLGQVILKRDLDTELSRFKGSPGTTGTDVIDYFVNTAPNGVSVLQVSQPVNGYNTTQSWFTFYKASNQYGRIEQRNINSDQIFVKCIHEGSWTTWDRYVKNSEVTPIGTVYYNAPSSNVVLNASASTKLCTVVVPKGTYLVIGKLGYRADFTSAYIGYTNSAGTDAFITYETEMSERTSTLTRAITFNESVTLFMAATGTGTVTVDGRLSFLQAIRLK